MDMEDLFRREPYELPKNEKEVMLLEKLNFLTSYHRRHCSPYRNILSALAKEDAPVGKLEDFPFLPVGLFKNFDLVSAEGTNGFTLLTSSGTTSQKLSRIFLDKRTALYQTKALVNILQSFIGKKRLPMIIVDTPSVLRGPGGLSARGAGVRGLLNFGRDHFYFLDDRMQPDFTGLEDFLRRHRGAGIIIFGFTFMVWQYFCKALAAYGKIPDMAGAVLIHSGGWKKLYQQSVDNATFKESLRRVAAVSRVYNFYGMVEQTGSVFMECEEGYFHASNFSDIVIRDPLTWGVMPPGREGLIEVISILPYSYPGHILLTEDMGTLVGEDTCACGRNGKYFTVSGRIPSAEMRGCSDIFAYGRTLHAV